jgi:hypothetical protein
LHNFSHIASLSAKVAILYRKIEKIVGEYKGTGAKER